MNQSKSKLGHSALIGVFVFAIILILATVVLNPLRTMLLIQGDRAFLQFMRYWFVVNGLRNIAAVVGALIFFDLLIRKAKPNVLIAFAAGLVFAVATYFITRVVARLGFDTFIVDTISYVIDFCLGTVVGFVYLSVTGNKAPAPAQPAPGSYTAPNAYSQPYAQPYAAPVAQQPENMDGLSLAILNAIRPSLKAPMTAVLCPMDQMLISNNNGEYDIRGIVNSQNSYGAMIATDFSVKARNYNGSWVISNVAVGKVAAKNYAKSFVSNYIAISIFVGLVGLLSYLVLTMLIG